MPSEYYPPAYTGSLGEPGSPNNCMSPVRQASIRVPMDPNVSSAGRRYSPPSVLLVEDDDDSLFILKSILRTKGYQVLEAWDGKTAVAVAEAETLDLILLDLQLPGLNGLGVIHHLRDNPNLENVPVVIMTGHDPEKYRAKAIEAGCDDFLLKPIDFDRLDTILDYFVPIKAFS